MRHLLANAFLGTFLTTPAALCGVLISSGMIEVSHGNISDSASLFLYGPGFSLSGFPSFVTVPGECTSATCSYSFANSINEKNVAFSGVLTYDGVTYDGSLAYTFDLSLNLFGPTLTVQNGIYPSNMGQGAFIYLEQWNASFTATGSFAVMNGDAIVASDTLTGGGTALAYDESVDYSGESQGTVQYLFAGDVQQDSSVPEPKALGTVGAGLLISGCLRRRSTFRGESR